jgi:hypothetical protein
MSKLYRAEGRIGSMIFVELTDEEVIAAYNEIMEYRARMDRIRLVCEKAQAEWDSEYMKKHYGDFLAGGRTTSTKSLCSKTCKSGMAALTGHMWHCPDCDEHLTSLLLCPKCGARYA